MGAYQETFERIEQKYLLGVDKYMELRRKLDGYA